MPAVYSYVLWTISLVAMMIGCIFTGGPTAAPTVAGCSAGGPGVVTPEDVACHLALAEPDRVQRIDDEITLLFAEPESMANWAGAAIFYHTPDGSMLVLDEFGDVDPHASVFVGRAGLVDFDDLSAQTVLMARLEEQVQDRWGTTPTHNPEIRLSVAWQDGPTTVFLVAVAGLTATDDRFYCPFQTWTIGDETIKFAADCMAHEPGSPVSHFFFMPQQIRGDQELPVQAALNGILSNTVLVSEGTVTQETAVYRAVLEHLTNRLLILHGETGPGTEDTADQLATAVDPDLLQAYLAANENSISLRYLFEKSRIYFVTPGAAVRRDYLPTRASAQACAVFHSEYPGLGGGIVTLSRIGYHEEGALVHVLQECGTNTDHQAIYYTLVRDDGVWQVTDTLKVSDDLAILEPQLDYLTRSSGCGDIFVYRSNASKSEFAIVSIDARSLDLSGEPVTLDLATNPDQVGVWIDVYAENVEKFGTIPYCSDIGRTNYPQSVWQAISGTVTVTVSANPPIEPCTGEAYQADVLIEDMIFALDAEMRHLPSLEFKDVTVGWCPG